MSNQKFSQEEENIIAQAYLKQFHPEAIEGITKALVIGNWIKQLTEGSKSTSVDPKLLELCKPIPAVKVAQFLDAVQAYSTLASQYVECANKHVDLVTVTKELGNIK